MPRSSPRGPVCRAIPRASRGGAWFSGQSLPTPAGVPGLILGGLTIGVGRRSNRGRPPDRTGRGARARDVVGIGAGRPGPRAAVAVSHPYALSAGSVSAWRTWVASRAGEGCRKEPTAPALARPVRPKRPRACPGRQHARPRKRLRTNAKATAGDWRRCPRETVYNGQGHARRVRVAMTATEGALCRSGEGAEARRPRQRHDQDLGSLHAVARAIPL